MVECLGILANLSLPDLDYSSLLQEYNLIPWIRDVLIPGNSGVQNISMIRCCYRFLMTQVNHPMT